MTVSHTPVPLVAPDVEAAVGLLRAQGLRLSSARRLVLEALFAADAPVAAEEIAGGLGGRLPRSDLASVYRNLERLEQLGLVRHMHLGHGPGRYAPAVEPATDYLLCERCGALDAVAAGALDGVRELLRDRFGFEARFSHFPIVGLCGGCAGTRVGNGRPGPV